VPQGERVVVLGSCNRANNGRVERFEFQPKRTFYA
jgi:hypothetical protein